MSVPNDDPNVVWENTVDQGAWHCKVVRVVRDGDGYTGHLTVTRVGDGEVILSREVGLAYGAMFGPDIDDLHYWEQTCIEAIDAQDPRGS